MPKSNEKVLFENEDGFKIKERLGDVEYFADILYSVASKYGLSNPPNLEKLQQITEKVLGYITSSRFDDAIGYPVYPNTEYCSKIIGIARNMIKIATKNLEKRETYHDLYSKIIEKLDKEEWIHEWDCKTR